MKPLLSSLVFAAGALFASTAFATHVAPLGGAVAVVNGEFSAVENFDDDGFDIEITGDFFAESGLGDLSVPRSFIASADIGVNGSPFFSGSAATGPIVIEDLLLLGAAVFGPTLDVTTFAPPNIGGVVDLSLIDLSPFGFSLGDIPGLVPLLPEVAFSIILTGGGASSISGLFELSTFISFDLIDDLPSSFAFSAELTLAPVPVPAALPLALTGAALLGGLGWRRRRRAAAA